MIVSSRRGRQSQQYRICINSLDEGTCKCQETDVFFRFLTWIKQVLTVVCNDGIVVMLTGTVDSIKWLFMEQTCKAMLFCCSFENIHDDQVLIHSNISTREYRSKFKLCRRNFIMFCFGIDTKFPQFFIDFLHVCLDATRNCTEVMVTQLLPLRSGSTEQCSSGQFQIQTLIIVFLVNQKVFLLQTYGNIA